MKPYVLVDSEQHAIEQEDQETRARRLFMYSEEALLAAETAELIHVSHPDFKVGLESLDRLVQLSRRLKTPNGILFLGLTGSGKTTLCRVCIQHLPQSSLFEPGSGAIYVRLQSHPTPGSVISSLLVAIKYPFPKVNAEMLYQKRGVLIEALRQKGTKVLFFDESQHLASQAKYRGSKAADETTASDIICELMDEAGVGVALLARDGFDLDQVDSALASRVSVRLKLRPFSVGPQWSGFVSAFVKASRRFDLSYLAETEQCELLHHATGGNLRSFKRLVTEAVLIAVDGGRSGLSQDVLCLAFERTAGTSGRRANAYLQKKAA